jgi:hypothetical protein
MGNLDARRVGTHWDHERQARMSSGRNMNEMKSSDCMLRHEFMRVYPGNPIRPSRIPWIVADLDPDLRIQGGIREGNTAGVENLNVGRQLPVFMRSGLPQRDGEFMGSLDARGRASLPQQNANSSR